MQAAASIGKKRDLSDGSRSKLQRIGSQSHRTDRQSMYGYAGPKEDRLS